MDLENQKRVKDFADQYGAENIVVVLGAAEGEAAGLAAETGTVIAANMWGKAKTVLQMLTIIFYYFVGARAGPTDVMAVSLITQILCWRCGAATLLSGGIYLWQNRQLFMQAK